MKTTYSVSAFNHQMVRAKSEDGLYDVAECIAGYNGQTQTEAK